MKYKKIVVGIAFLLSACVTDPKPPAGALSKEQMVAILVEVHIAEAKAQQAGFRTSDSTQFYYKYLEKKILKDFKTDSTQYHDSYRFYVQHIKLMNEIYTAVVDTLTARQSEGRMPEKLNLDSVRTQKKLRKYFN